MDIELFWGDLPFSGLTLAIGFIDKLPVIMKYWSV